MKESDHEPPEEHKQGDDKLDGIEQGFFYDEDILEEVDEGDSIADRILRRRGCRHIGEGHME